MATILKQSGRSSWPTNLVDALVWPIQMLRNKQDGRSSWSTSVVDLLTSCTNAQSHTDRSIHTNSIAWEKSACFKNAVTLKFQNATSQTLFREKARSKWSWIYLSRSNTKSKNLFQFPIFCTWFWILNFF